MELERRYAFYHFKKSLVRLIIMVLYCCIIAAVSTHTQNDLPQGTIRHFFDLNVLGINLVIVGGLSAILEFSEFKNRRNLDSWFSFPLDRWKIALVHYLNGAVHLFLAHTLSFIVAYVKIAPYKTECHLDMSVMPVFYFSVLFLGLMFYGFCMFPFILANNIFDGVVFAVLYNIVPMMLQGWIGSLLIFTDLRWISDFFASPCQLLMEEAGRCTGNLTLKMYREIYEENGMTSDLTKISLTSEEIARYIIISVICIALTVLAIRVFASKKTEDIGGISASLPGYRLLIPVMMIGRALKAVGSIPGGITYAIVTFVAYVIFRRGVKLKIPDIIVVVVVLILGLIPVDILLELSKLMKG